MTDHCRSCGATITFGLTDKGKNMPLDPPSADGSMYTWTVTIGSNSPQLQPVKQRRVSANPPPNVETVRVNSHFATCPQAGKHRRRGTP